MLENIIMNMDFNQAKQFLRNQNINLSDDEIRYLLPILQRNLHDLKDPKKRQSIMNTLPPNLQHKINDLMTKYAHFL